MNLDELLEEIGQELVHEPNSNSEKSYRARKLNDAYMELMDQRWTFLERLVEYQLRADETTTIDGIFTNGSKVVTVVGFTSAHWSTADVVGPDGELYEVAGLGVSTIGLSTAYAGTNVTTTFTLRWSRYALPVGCRDLLGMMMRDDELGELPLTTMTRERSLMLNPDDEPATPQAWLLDPDRQDREPRATLAGAASAGAGLTAGVEYRYFYAFIQAGRISGRSNIVSVTPTPGNLQVALSGMETHTANTGVVKWVYRETARSGLFRRIGTVIETVATLTDTGLTESNDYPWQPPGPYSYFRTWPRTDVDRKVELRYLFRPERLQHGNAVPAFPEVYHSILVNLALVQIMGRHGEGDDLGKPKGGSSVHAKLARDKLRKMRVRYLTRSAGDWKRKDWGVSGGPSALDRPTVTLVP